MDLQRIPESLRHLAPFVERWTACGHEAILARLEAAKSNPAKWADARRFGELFTPELQEEFHAWADREPITESEESSDFYFALGVLDDLDLLQSDYRENSVSGHIETLSKFGSYRLASKRMFTARSLGEQGEKARDAVGPLRTALTDEDSRVRIWAHFALFAIEHEPSHLEAIRGYLQHVEEEVKSEAAAALGQIGRPAASAIPDLIASVENAGEDDFSVGVLLGALALLGADDPTAREAIMRAARSDNEWVRNEARSVIDSMRDG